MKRTIVFATFILLVIVPIIVLGVSSAINDSIIDNSSATDEVYTANCTIVEIISSTSANEYSDATYYTLKLTYTYKTDIYEIIVYDELFASNDIVVGDSHTVFIDLNDHDIYSPEPIDLIEINWFILAFTFGLFFFTTSFIVYQHVNSLKTRQAKQDKLIAKEGEKVLNEYNIDFTGNRDNYDVEQNIKNAKKYSILTIVTSVTFSLCVFLLISNFIKYFLIIISTLAATITVIVLIKTANKIILINKDSNGYDFSSYTIDEFELSLKEGKFSASQLFKFPKGYIPPQGTYIDFSHIKERTKQKNTNNLNTTNVKKQYVDFSTDRSNETINDDDPFKDFYNKNKK